MRDVAEYNMSTFFTAMENSNRDGLVEMRIIEENVITLMVILEDILKSSEGIQICSWQSLW